MQKSLVVIALLGCLVSGTGQATQVGPGYISQPAPSSNGALLFYLVDASGNMMNRTGLPSCAISQTSRWAVDASDSTGGLMQANALISLWKNRTPITITGLNVCSIWSDTETVQTFLASW